MSTPILPKTMELLNRFKPGEFTPSRDCYDESEIVQLGAVLNSLLYAPAPVRQRLNELGVTVTPSNFYSEIPTIAEIAEPKPFEKAQFSEIFDAKIQAEFLESLMEFAKEFAPH